MKYAHTMVRVSDLELSLDFYCNKLGLQEIRRMDNHSGRFSLIFLAAPGDETAQIELTHNWDEKGYDGGRNFGHVAYRVPNIYATCEQLQALGVVINRPPRKGCTGESAFLRRQCSQRDRGQQGRSDRDLGQMGIQHARAWQIGG